MQLNKIVSDSDDIKKWFPGKQVEMSSVETQISSEKIHKPEQLEKT